jgi:ribosomal peptide maturation radical SAM protein 1
MTPVADTLDVVLASMPFAPAHLPTIGIELLKAAVPARRIRTVYFTVEYLRRFGPQLYRTVVDRHSSLIGEWIFSPALFDTDPEDVEAFLAALAVDPQRRLDPAQTRLVRAARAGAAAFVEECADRLLAHDPALVGLTTVFQQHIATLAVARRLKQRRPSLPVILGGANCEGPMGIETARTFSFLDGVVSGEADLIFAALVERAVSGEPLAGIQGLITHQDACSGAASFALAPRVERMDDLPVPDYDGFFADWDAAGVAWPTAAKVPFETSRGCWWGEKHHCTFCGLNVKSMAFRSKSAARVLDELEATVARYPDRPVMVVDNILDMRYFQDLLPALAKRQLPVTLFYEVKANLRKDQLKLMYDAGIRDIQPGIESLSRPVLDLMRKGVTPLQNIQLLKWCAELGVSTHWNWLWGFPGEPIEEYTRLAGVIPLLSHLPPPQGIGMLRLDRFSPNFTDYRALGFASMKAAPEYYAVYPLPAEAVENLAYYFKGEYADGRDPEAYVAPTRAAIQAWRAAYADSELIAVERDDDTWIFDSRPGFGGLTMLSGLERMLYRACDSSRTAAGLARMASAHESRRVEENEIRDLLAPYLENGLMIEEDGQLLALAVAGQSDTTDAPTAGDAPVAVRVSGGRTFLPMA